MASHAMKKAVNAVTDVVFPAPKNVNEVQKQQLLQSGKVYHNIIVTLRTHSSYVVNNFTNTNDY